MTSSMVPGAQKSSAASAVEEKDRIGIKNISSIMQSISLSGNRVSLIKPDEGFVVSQDEYDRKYKDSRDPNGALTWKVIPVAEVVQPSIHRLKSMGGEDSENQTEQMVDKTFIDGLKSMIGIAAVEDIDTYIKKSTSYITLQAVLTVIKDCELEKEEKAKIMQTTVARITELK